MLEQQEGGQIAPSNLEGFQQPKKSKLPLIIGLAAVFCILLGGLAFAYFKYFRISDNDEIKKAFLKMEQVKSFEYSGEVKITIKGLDVASQMPTSFDSEINVATSTKTTDFSIKFTGASDVSNIENAKSRFNIEMQNIFSKEPTPPVIFQDISIGEVFYLNFKSIPVNFTSSSFIDLSSIVNKWIKIDFKAIKEQFGLDKLNKVVSSTSEITEAQRKEVYAEFNKVKIYTAKREAAESVDGVPTNRFRIVINPTETKAFLVKSNEILGSKITQTEMEKYKKEVDDLSSAEIRLWLGKDSLVYKIELKFTKLSNDNSGASGEGAIDIYLKNHNKPVVIDAPSESKDIQEVIGEIMSQMMGSYTTSSSTLNNYEHPPYNTVSSTTYTGGSYWSRRAASKSGAVVSSSSPTVSAGDLKDSDSDGLTDSTELVLHTNPYNPDTDGDGYSDGQEYYSGYNPNGPGLLKK